jgi:hypothetical protein
LKAELDKHGPENRGWKKTRQTEQESRESTGEPGKYSRDRKFWTGRPGQDILDRTAWTVDRSVGTGQPEISLAKKLKVLLTVYIE